MTCCSKWLRLALWSVVAAAASVASPGTAGASEKGTLTVKDNGSVFTADGIRKAEDAFEAVTFQAPTKLAVVTFGKVPEGKRAAFEAAKDKQDKDRFFREWAEEVARSSGKPDVLVFISMEGSTVRAIDDRRTEVKRGFDDKDLRTVRDKFVAGFKPGAGEDSAAKLARHDAALLESVNFVADQLKDTTLPANQNGRRANAPANNAAETKGTSVMTYVCIGIVALLGIWLVIGVVRMMMGGGGGGGGGNYGGGMGGGGGGMGAGGGLMTGLLGGMLGAVAGNYLYNNFLGGNSHSNDSMGSSGGYGDSGNTGDTGAGDYNGGGDSGGGDFSGGDTGGSSGDFGGGDSGGGDFGGGGSDFGGGGGSGGGDW